MLLAILDVLRTPQYRGTNITAMRLVDPGRAEVQELLGEMGGWEEVAAARQQVHCTTDNCVVSSRVSVQTARPAPLTVQTDIALLYDAVHLFAAAIGLLDQSQVEVPLLPHPALLQFAGGDHRSTPLRRPVLGSWQLTRQLYEDGEYTTTQPIWENPVVILSIYFFSQVLIHGNTK